MIISKDLFIFGEQIFATIIPEGGTTTTTAQATQQQQQQAEQQQPQREQQQQTSIINTINAAAPANTTTTTTAVAAAPTTIPAIAAIITTTTAAAAIGHKTETITTPGGGAATALKKIKIQKIPKENEELRKKKEKPQQQLQLLQLQQKQQQQQQQPKGIQKQNGGTTINAKKSAEKSTLEQQQHVLTIAEPIAVATAAATTTAVTDAYDDDEEAEVAEKKPLVKSNTTKITASTTVADTATAAAATIITLQPTATTTTAAAVTQVVAAAAATVDRSSANSEDLSINMDKVMLGNNARSEHAMVTFPFMPEEQQRTLQLTFQNVNVLHNERKILADVSGLVSPGEVLAIMGPSGSGKTTLLDCLSGQRRIDSGSIYLNREQLSKKWRRKICYVLQEEVFFSGLTLRETVMYTALLRLPEKMSRKDKTQMVDRILEELELTFCQQTKFGDYLNRGLSGGEKKRANIACELLTNPLLMLLDEPTSGLDSHSAISLMKILKRYAMQEQKTVVITVHQPSSQMFHMFDKLLLLYNGRTAYFGEVNNIYRYFEDIGVAIKPHYNPADFVLEQLKSYPDIREKLFVAAKESHGNFINRNCITAVNTNNHQNQHNHHNHNGNSVANANGTANAYATAPPATTAVPVVNDKSNQQDTLINDIINNYYYKDRHTNHHHHNNHMNNDAVRMLGNHHHAHNSLEEAAQQLWCGGDSQSNFSTASSDCQHYESGGGGGSGVNSADWLDYPTRFHTQFSVLSSRNFKEAKPRMLSKLNWFQTIGLALMAGAIWFQIPRTEEFLHDLQGWMFFSQTYWMLFALFGALNSFPSEREVISKERRSGAYRLSAYYLAKMCGELPLVVTLPTVYLMISYPMLGCTSFKLFFLMLVFLLLNTIVAQSVGFFIGACCMDMNVSITLSALYTLATQLFGGYLSTRIPEGLSWIRYTSMIHYAYQNMQILEFREGPAIRCGSHSSYEICNDDTSKFIPYEEILKAQNSTSPLWLNTFILMMFFLVFRALGYAVLRYVRCPKAC